MNNNKQHYATPLLRMIPLRSEESFLASLGNGIGDWRTDDDTIDF